MGSKQNKKKLKKNKKLSPQKLLKQTKSTGPRKSRLDSKQVLTILGILLITFFSFLPSLDNQYVNWDDDRNFSENELITTINPMTFWSNSGKIFKTHVIGNYNPLTIFTFAIEQRLISKDKLPFWRHLNNILLHLVATFFVFWIGIRLGLNLFGAAILALLFGIQPMRVESVAWVTERKDVLFGAFYLAAMYYYIRGKVDGFRKLDHFIILICFILSLLSKIQAVLLPVSLVLVDYYLSKKDSIDLKGIISKSHLFALSLIIGLVNIYFLRMQGSIADQAYTGLDRVFIGSYSLIVYYIKALIPYRLSPLYPYPSSLDWTFYASIVSFFGTAYLLYWSYKRKLKVIFFGVGFFIVNIFLLLQILGAGQGFLADRFTYIAYLGLFFIFAYYLQKVITEKASLKLPIMIVSGLIIAGYAFMTFQQNKVWKDSATLWGHVLKYYQKSTLPWGNRANYYRDIGNVKAALSDYDQVIKLKPINPQAYNSRARLYFNFNQPDSLKKALYNYNKAIEQDPKNVEFMVNRGATYAKMGDLNRSIANLNQAEDLDPSFANIYLNRSVIYSQSGNIQEALNDIDRYLKLKPNYPDMWYEKGRLHNGLKQHTQAKSALDNAIGMKNNYGIYYFERAKSNFMLGDKNSAKQDIQTSQGLGYKADPEVVNQIMNSF